MSAVVAIVGRPNVGKSTLFNRLTQAREAIVDDQSGVTRDRHYGQSEWNGKEFTVIDTGGYVHNSEDIFEAAIREQVEIAIDEADILLFMVDVATGITDLDMTMTQMLRGSKKPVLLVVNKVDNQNRALEANEFYSLGLGDIHLVSSVSGSGTGDLLDEVANLLPEIREEEDEEGIPKYAIVGRPNAGKSTLLNALLEEERSIVTDIPGTTRDTLSAEYKKFGKHFMLMDTAGLRKKAKVHENVEFYSVLRSLKAIEAADVCLLLVDATQGFQAQDVNIFQVAQRRRKGLVILVNKWDTVEKDTQSIKKLTETIHEKIAPFIDVPIVFISALEKQRIFKALDMAEEVYANRVRKASTSKLNDIMLPYIQATPPPSVRGRYIRIKYITQLKASTPTFGFFCNHPKDVKENYQRFLENKMREHFNFSGVPINLFFRQK